MHRVQVFSNFLDGAICTSVTLLTFFAAKSPTTLAPSRYQAPLHRPTVLLSLAHIESPEEVQVVKEGVFGYTVPV